MITTTPFVAHSGALLPFKIDCADFTDEYLAGFAQIVASRVEFGEVVGIPTGGLRFATTLAVLLNLELPPRW